MVVVIIGIMAMMLGPTFTTGSDIARVKTATRGIMQMSRYARTMAVLHQMPVALVLSADGSIRVERAEGGNETPSVSVTPELSDRSDKSDQSGGGGKAYVMADLEAEKSYVQVLFDVSLDDFDVDDRDSAAAALFEEQENEKGGEADEDVKEVKTVRVIYESNGRCLPYRVVVRAEGQELSAALTVEVDRFGVARVLEDAL